MTTALRALPALLLCTAAAAAPRPVADPLLSRLIADARALPPSALAFERDSRSVTQAADGETDRNARIDRWDGRSFSLISINGKQPTAKDNAGFQKAVGSRPVPGYHRLADLLAAGAVRQTDPQGRILYRVSALPKGSVTVGRDVSANISGEFLVDASGAQPYVTSARLVLTKPMSFMMVARLDSLEITNDYKLDGAGRPYLARAVQLMSGAQFGKRGSTRSESLYTLLR